MSIFIGKIHVEPLNELANYDYTIMISANNYKDAMAQLYNDFENNITKVIFEEYLLENDSNVIATTNEWNEILELKEKYDKFSF